MALSLTLIEVEEVWKLTEFTFKAIFPLNETSRKAAFVLCVSKATSFHLNLIPLHVFTDGGKTERKQTIWTIRRNNKVYEAASTELAYDVQPVCSYSVISACAQKLRRLNV